MWDDRLERAVRGAEQGGAFNVAPEALITGVGATTSLGGDVPTTWRQLLAGKSGVVAMRKDQAQGFAVRLSAPLHSEPAEVLARVEVRRLDRSQQCALIAAREAWSDAESPAVDPERLTVIIGTGVGGALTMLAQDDTLEERGPGHVSPFTIPMLMPNGPAAAVSIELGARGGTHAPVSACASGAEAIAVGLAMIRSGRTDVAVCGGADACLHPLSVAGFARMGALSRREDDPAGASRPFDRDRGGFVMGEGAGVIVLERAEFARARGARAYARLVGAAVTSDAHHITTPDRCGQVRALRGALASAGLTPADVAHVNAHATGTRTGDLVEAEAIGEAIGMHANVTAPKSALGHLLGAAGAVEAIVTALTVRDGVIPPTRNLENQDPDIKLDVVTGEACHTQVPVAVSNSFGFGGHNVVLAMARAS